MGASKNDLVDEDYKGEEMEFPNTFEEFANEYGFKDKEEVYTNGPELIPVFRVKQWLEHISTTKNDLGVDCVSRQAISGYIDYILSHGMGKKKSFGFIKKFVDKLPSVTPQPRKGHWIEEIDDYGKVMRWHCDKCYEDSGFTTTCKWDFCPNCGADMRRGGIMTREEAIKMLKSKMDGHTDTSYEWAETVRMAIKALEQEPKWIPMTTRPMTEEEREHYREWPDVEGAKIFDCTLPEDGQEVLVCYGGYVCVDTFCKDDGCYFEGVDIDDVDAWMPLPAPFEPQESER